MSVNLLDAEKLILGRLAMADERSLGDYVRRLVVTGLRTSNPTAAQEMEKARTRHNKQMLLKL